MVKWMATNKPRQHHIVPAFYLAGFTDTGTVEGRLHAFDYPRNRHYSASPRHVCKERDYFRIYEPDYDPYVVERDMAELEQGYAATLQEIRAEGRIRRTEQLRVALEMAAFIHSRTRKNRHQLARYLRFSIHSKLVAGQVTETQWEDLRAAEFRAGADPRDVPPYAEVRDLVVRGNWRPRAPQVLLVGLVRESHQMTFDTLIKRDWEIMMTDTTENGGFITSESPLVWGPIPERNQTEMHASLGDPHVEVTFPLSNALALVSYKGARHSNCSATDEAVAHVNSRTLFHSFGTLFFPRRTFLLEQKTGVCSSADYFDYIRRERERGIIRP